MIKKIILLNMVSVVLFANTADNLKTLCFNYASYNSLGLSKHKITFQSRTYCNSKENILGLKYLYKVFYKSSDGLPVKFEVYSINNKKLLETVYLNNKFIINKIVKKDKNKTIICNVSYSNSKNYNNLPKEILSDKYFLKSNFIKDKIKYYTVIQDCNLGIKIIKISFNNYLKESLLYILHYQTNKIIKKIVSNGKELGFYNIYDKDDNLINHRKIPITPNYLPVRIPEYDDYPFMDKEEASKRFTKKYKKLLKKLP